MFLRARSGALTLSEAEPIGLRPGRVERGPPRHDVIRHVVNGDEVPAQTLHLFWHGHLLPEQVREVLREADLVAIGRIRSSQMRRCDSSVSSNWVAKPNVSSSIPFVPIRNQPARIATSGDG